MEHRTPYNNSNNNNSNGNRGNNGNNIGNNSNVGGPVVNQSYADYDRQRANANMAQNNSPDGHTVPSPVFTERPPEIMDYETLKKQQQSSNIKPVDKGVISLEELLETRASIPAKYDTSEMLKWRAQENLDLTDFTRINDNMYKVAIEMSNTLELIDDFRKKAARAELMHEREYNRELCMAQGSTAAIRQAVAKIRTEEIEDAVFAYKEVLETLESKHKTLSQISKALGVISSNLRSQYHAL